MRPTFWILRSTGRRAGPIAPTIDPKRRNAMYDIIRPVAYATNNIIWAPVPAAQNNHPINPIADRR
ncbi:hypothetical protein BBIA_2039 [Bifidobacterium biavatii DSM 23969]|uniref:Uncharacterized protein n=1 Tax=Bifidobacterium biavatii DSM 23969 TaxID=1437608 RepID=A0A086ZVZ1_9BIFI|nr:hypothetical protein BBIA_2039 [Bifidobacterium biavatii DSM 23969]